MSDPPVQRGELAPCLRCVAAGRDGYLAERLDAIADEEAPTIPDGLPPVVDAHVHLFPTPVFRALWRWFDEHAWPVRYALESDEVVHFLKSRGIERFVALHYAHKPGMAEGLNAYMAEVVSRHEGVVGTATVLPGEPDAVGILERAFALFLSAFSKLTAHKVS